MLIRRQSGSMLVLAIFVMIVIAVLAVGIIRVVSDMEQGVVYEVRGQRAFFAAQSGLQSAANALFPIGANVLTACPVVALDLPNLQSRDVDNNLSAVPAFENCQVNIVCSCIVIGNSTENDSCEDADNSLERVFTVTSTASCGNVGNAYGATRRLQITARTGNGL